MRLRWMCAVLALAAIGCGGLEHSEHPNAAALRLDYGPILRDVDSRSARFLFHASRVDGGEEPWTAGIEIHLDPAETIATTTLEVTAATDFVAHLTVEGLQPQTRYTYVPLINGRRGLEAGADGLPSFVTPPDLDGRNADFTVVFLADQHTAGGDSPEPFAAYAAAAEARPMFWAQLGDAAAGTLAPERAEEDRTRANLGALWRRNYGDPELPQARFAREFSLDLASISDHELMDNFSMNWHQSLTGVDADATLHDRVARYHRSVGTWWNYFGSGGVRTDPLGRVARTDHGESVMAEAPVRILDDVTGRTVCVERETSGGFEPGSFVYLADDGGVALHTRVTEVGAGGGCADGRGTRLTLAAHTPRTIAADHGAQVAVGARYATAGLYHGRRPFPYVEFFLLDTTSYRGDPYQVREFYGREANRDSDHSRYPWDADDGRMYIFRDREHGANRTTDGVRSWLGPTQKRAFLESLAVSDAEVLVVAAGYPLHSAKFEWSERYWTGRESGFDFAAELEQILDALEAKDKLVLWVHGDGHTPMLVRLRPNIYQLQIGPTRMGHTESPGHRSRTLQGGDRSDGDSIGGGELIAGHQPDLRFHDDREDLFAAHLDQFEGYLRLYFHPGREALRNAEHAGLRRGDSDRVVEMPADGDPARGAAAAAVVGKVVRLHFGDRRAHSVVTGYRYQDGQARLELRDPIVSEDPDMLRLVLDGNAWVEARWFDSRGREWRDFATVLRHR